MIKLLAISAVLLSCNLQTTESNVSNHMTSEKVIAAKSIYDFKVEALDGSTIDFSTFKGKKY